MMEISSRGFVVYLLSASSLAVLSVFFLPRSQDPAAGDGSPLLLLPSILSSRSVRVWPKEEVERQQEALYSKCIGDHEVIVDADYAPLVPQQERSGLDILRSNIRWKDILVLCVVWFCFVVLQVLKTNAAVCSPLYWLVNVLQFPAAMSVFGWKAAGMYRKSKERRMAGNWECVCEASIEWSGLQLLFCALCGVVGGTVGGLLGSGGGFVLGPLLLEIGVIPQPSAETSAQARRCRRRLLEPTGEEHAGAP